jgi:excisionase family DNA binding protein
MANKLTIDREWLSLRELAEYAGVGERTLRRWLRRENDALPAVRVGGKILVRKSQFDEWLEHHRFQPGPAIDLDGIANGLLNDAE